MKKGKKTKIDVSWTGYSNKDKDKIVVRSDKTFFEHVWHHKTVRNRIIAIVVIGIILLIL